MHLFLNSFWREHLSPIKISLDLTGHGKSIICQEDVYFKELLRYIHLNPLRAKLVADIKELNKYPYSGHSVLTGNKRRKWCDT